LQQPQKALPLFCTQKLGPVSTQKKLGRHFIFGPGFHSKKTGPGFHSNRAQKNIVATLFFQRKSSNKNSGKASGAADAHPDSTRIFLHPLEVAAVVP
jgi:hypothetical protein